MFEICLLFLIILPGFSTDTTTDQTTTTDSSSTVTFNGNCSMECVDGRLIKATNQCSTSEEVMGACDATTTEAYTTTIPLTTTPSTSTQQAESTVPASTTTTNINIETSTSTTSTSTVPTTTTIASTCYDDICWTTNWTVTTTTITPTSTSLSSISANDNVASTTTTTKLSASDTTTTTPTSTTTSTPKSTTTSTTTTTTSPTSTSTSTSTPTSSSTSTFTTTTTTVPTTTSTSTSTSTSTPTTTTTSGTTSTSSSTSTSTPTTTSPLTSTFATTTTAATCSDGICTTTWVPTTTSQTTTEKLSVSETSDSTGTATSTLPNTGSTSTNTDSSDSASDSTDSTTSAGSTVSQEDETTTTTTSADDSSTETQTGSTSTDNVSEETTTSTASESTVTGTVETESTTALTGSSDTSSTITETSTDTSTVTTINGTTVTEDTSTDEQSETTYSSSSSFSDSTISQDESTATDDSTGSTSSDETTTTSDTLSTVSHDETTVSQDATTSGDVSTARTFGMIEYDDIETHPTDAKDTTTVSGKVTGTTTTTVPLSSSSSKSVSGSSSRFSSSSGTSTTPSSSASSSTTNSTASTVTSFSSSSIPQSSSPPSSISTSTGSTSSTTSGTSTTSQTTSGIVSSDSSTSATSPTSKGTSTRPSSTATTSVDNTSSDVSSSSSSPTTATQNTKSTISQQSSGSSSSLTSQGSSSTVTSSTSTSEQNTSTTVPTTTDAECSIQCPDGYLVGTNSCYLILSTTDVTSYQTALSLCRQTEEQDLIGLEKLRVRNDLTVLTTYSVNNGMTWFFANGGGSQLERFDKEAQVFNIFDMTIASSPIAATYGVSDTTSNVSAICVLPQYCNAPQCEILTSLEVLGLDTELSTSANTISAKATATITCSYDSSTTKVTCGSRGTITPSPTMITCSATSDSEVTTNTTGQLVDSCDDCYSDGTSSCKAVDYGNGTSGYECICKSSYSMNTCWYSGSQCTSTSCNNGTCIDLVDSFYCDCDWGYEGDTCTIDKNPAVKYANDSQSVVSRLVNTADFSSLSAFTVTVWSVLTISIKTVGKITLSNDEDDPQETHQSLRGILLTLATTCVLLFQNPYLFNIPTATCRAYFLLIHFLYVYSLTQWTFEGFNANQVLRCRHVNKWETGFDGKPYFSIMAVPRLVTSMIIAAAVLIIIYQSGWYQLVSTWTCIGVICKTTSSMWLPIGFCIGIIFLFATAVFENSILVMYRRPLFNLMINSKIDKEEGIVSGQNIEKCRRNVTYCLFGCYLLGITWFFTLMSADDTNNKILGLLSVIGSAIYGLFSCLQGIVTCPPTYAMLIRFLMRKLPARIAPTYEPMKMWTRQEILDLYSQNDKKTREKLLDEHLPINARNFLMYKWNFQFSKFPREMSKEEKVTQIIRKQLDKMKQDQASTYQIDQVIATFSTWLQNLPNDDNIFSVDNEKVSICTTTFDDISKPSTFFINPGFGCFKPIISDSTENEIEAKKMNYEILRKEVEAQSNFIHSANHFKHFGKITE